MRHEIAPFKEDVIEDDTTETEDSDGDMKNSVENQGEQKTHGRAVRGQADAAQPEPGPEGEDEANEGGRIRMKCEVKEFESRHNLKGQEILKEIGEKPDADEEENALYALRYYTYYNREGETRRVTLEVHSAHIQAALKAAVKAYPGVSFGGDIIIFDGQTKADAFGCLYHYQDELESYAKQSNNASIKLDIALAIKLMHKKLRRESRDGSAQMGAIPTPSISFRDLWMAFKPGDLACSGKNETETILKISKTEFNPGGFGEVASWNVYAKNFAHDGNSFGFIERSYQISAFQGTKSLRKLDIRPLKYHKDEMRLRQKQLVRGKLLCDLVGIQHCAYKGKALSVEHERTPTWYGGKDEYREEAITLDGRIIIDHVTFVKNRTTRKVKFEDEDENISRDAITPAHLLLSNFEVPGFSLTEKRWCWFRLDFISDIDWDSGAFELLMVPTSYKRVLRALSRQHLSTQDNFDDMIKGKGKGCIFLLHGPPGIGKTFTVESIADDIKRPLYVMMSGELGSDIGTVEKNLKQVLHLVTTWKAILLLDEADVFLEKRSSHDLARNGLVSIFLRTLEYFSGIMFLTTNRIDSFDLAFQSRIHLALKYQELSFQGRVELWKLFLRRTSDFDELEWPLEAIEQFAAVPLNGRQIKNSIRTANTLALSEGQRLSAEEVRVVLSTVQDFNADFQGDVEENAVTETSEMQLGSLGLAKGIDPKPANRTKSSCCDC